MMSYILRLAGAAGFVAASAFAVAAAPNDKVVQYEGTEFACAGVSNQSQNDPRWDRFPLKMVFTNVDGDYLGDVSVSVKNADGDVVVAADCAAPWFLATLDEGNYTADVVAHGRYEKSLDFNVSGDGQTRVVVPFPQITGT